MRVEIFNLFFAADRFILEGVVIYSSYWVSFFRNIIRCSKYLSIENFFEITCF